MRKLLVGIIVFLVFVVVYSLIYENTRLFTGSSVFMSCMIGNYVGCVLKDKNTKMTIKSDVLHAALIFEVISMIVMASITLNQVFDMNILSLTLPAYVHGVFCFAICIIFCSMLFLIKICSRNR